jgi:hypothetical protein
LVYLERSHALRLHSPASRSSSRLPPPSFNTCNVCRVACKSSLLLSHVLGPRSHSDRRLSSLMNGLIYCCSKSRLASTKDASRTSRTIRAWCRSHSRHHRQPHRSSGHHSRVLHRLSHNLLLLSADPRQHQRPHVAFPNGGSPPHGPLYQLATRGVMAAKRAPPSVTVSPIAMLLLDSRVDRGLSPSVGPVELTRADKVVGGRTEVWRRLRCTHRNLTSACCCFEQAWQRRDTA